MENKEVGSIEESPTHLHHVSPTAGYVTVSGPLLPGQASEAETQMCVHCQHHWIIVPGSGRVRGFCFLCNGLTCGDPRCEECIPWEKKLEISEGRNPTKTQF